MIEQGAERTLAGVSASEGLAIGPALMITRQGASRQAGTPEEEAAALAGALRQAAIELSSKPAFHFRLETS